MFKYASLIAAILGYLIVSEAAAAQLVDRRLFASDAVYELHLANASFRHCDLNRDGAFQPEELPCYDAMRSSAASLQPMQVVVPASSAPLVQEYAARRVSRIAPASGSRADHSVHEIADNESSFGPTGILASSVAPRVTAESGRYLDCEELREMAIGPEVAKSKLVIRRSKADIGTWVLPSCFNKSIGAEFAWANDRIDEKEVWSALGVVAYPIALQDPLKLGLPLSVAPYIGFDRISKAKSAEELIDNLTYGGVLEVDLEEALGAAQLINVDAGLLTGFGGEAKNWSVNVTWQPKGIGNNTGNGSPAYRGRKRSPGSWLTYTLSPRLETGFTQEISEANLQPIFTEKDSVLRSGAAVTLKLDGQQNAPWPLSNMRYELSYGWLYDWLSRRDYALFDTALSVGLNKTGLIGLTFSYRKGDLEETGQDVDLAKAALSVAY